MSDNENLVVKNLHIETPMKTSRDKTTRRIDRDGNEVRSTSIGRIPVDMHDLVKEMAKADRYSVGNIYSDAIVSMQRARECGESVTLLNPLSCGTKTQVWLRDEADDAMRSMCHDLFGDNTAVVYTAMVRFFEQRGKNKWTTQTS